MLSKTQRVLCALAALVATAGFVWLILWLVGQLTLLTAQLESHKPVNVSVQPENKDTVSGDVLVLDPVTITAPGDDVPVPSPNSAIEVLEQILLTATVTQEAVAAEGVAAIPTEVIQSVEKVIVPNKDESVPKETIDQSGKDLGGLYQAVEDGDKALRAAQATQTSSSPSEKVGSSLVERLLLDSHTPSLWVFWDRQDTLYRLQNPWPHFWKRTSEMSGIPHTEEAWRKISTGTVVLIPARSIYVASATQFRSLAVSDKFPDENSGTMLQEVIPLPMDVLAEHRAESAAKEAALFREYEQQKNSADRKNLFIILLGFTTGVFLVGMFLISLKNHSLETQLTNLRDDYVALGKRLREAESVRSAGPSENTCCGGGQTAPQTGGGCGPNKECDTPCCGPKKEDNGSSCCDPR